MLLHVVVNRDIIDFQVQNFTDGKFMVYAFDNTGNQVIRSPNLQQTYCITHTLFTETNQLYFMCIYISSNKCDQSLFVSWLRALELLILAIMHFWHLFINLVADYLLKHLLAL